MSQSSRLSRRVFIAGLSAAGLALLSGCGYRLAGEHDLPEAIRTVALQGLSDNEPVLRAFQAQLARSSAEWTEQRASADVLVVVEDFQLERRAMIIGPGGAVAENEIRAEMAFHFRYPKSGQPDARSKTQYLSHARSVNYDRNAVLASSSNESEVQAEVAERMGRNLFYRLYSAKPPKID